MSTMPAQLRMSLSREAIGDSSPITSSVAEAIGVRRLAIGDVGVDPRPDHQLAFVRLRHVDVDA